MANGNEVEAAVELEPGIELVKSRSGKADAETEFEYNFGADLEAAVGLFGEEAVYDMYLAGARINVQGTARRSLEVGVAPDRVAATMAEYVLGQSSKADPMTSALRSFDNMDGDQQKEAYEQLKAKLGL